jgi:hypothetical protein
LRGHHVPGMDEYGGAFVSAMVEEREDSRVIEIFIADVIADLHAEMPRTHAAGEFGAGGVNILQRNLAERAQPSFAASADFERRIIKHVGAIQRVPRFAVVGKKNGRSGNNLMIYVVTIHLLEADIRIPARRGDLPKHAIADHDRGFAGLGVLDLRPIRRAKARCELRPRFREEVSVNVGNWHSVFGSRTSPYFFAGLPGWTSPQLGHTRNFSS